MKTAKHTAGPYQYDYYGDHASFCGSENYLDYTFRVEFSEEMPEQDRIGTCNLIEAAPDLLKWCERILLSHETQGAATNGEAVLCHAFVIGLKDVIAKATAI